MFETLTHGPEAAQHAYKPLSIMLMIATTFVFAVQDGISRHLAENYNVVMIVMIRYWFFAAFVITIATKQSGSIRAAAAGTKAPT